MTKLTPQQLREKYQKLPEDLKDAIFSVDSADIIQNVGKKYSLAIDKIGELADETGLVMLGLTHPKEFVPNLGRRLGADKETARKIAEDINKQIFAKVRESLKKVHNLQDTSNKMQDTNKIQETRDKEEILKEIEKDESVRPPGSNIPEILSGSNKPESEKKTPFEAKTGEEIHRKPPQVSEHYPEGDPYREEIK